jgi:hypothetical protein
MHVISPFSVTDGHPNSKGTQDGAEEELCRRPSGQITERRTPIISRRILVEDIETESRRSQDVDHARDD